jgi:hypothetical protein
MMSSVGKYVLWGILVAAPASEYARAAEQLALLPSRIVLRGPGSRQRLVVERLSNGRFVGDVADGLSFATSDPNVVAVNGGVAAPVGNGTAKITCRSGALSAEADVIVTHLDKPFAWSFRNHIQSILARFGCSSGACHGAAAGKKGFKLSLRGYDPEGDYHVLTRQARGRRVLLDDPGRSLLLLKPTSAVPHGGGERFAVGSIEYRAIAQWIAAGAPPPQPDDPRIERIEFLPARCVLDPKASQQLLVTAYFSDGHTEDVTHWAKYTSANVSVANVDDNGRVAIVGPGEAAISAWYLNKLAVATVTVPYPDPVPGDVFAKTETRNFIDELTLAKLRDLIIPPSPTATDAEFLRRAYLDTIGVLPTPAEAREFLNSPAADKRDRLIQSLLNRPEFVDYWSYKLSDVLLVNSERLAQPAMWAYYNWIRHHVAANTPWDQMVRELVTANGSTLENGAANFYVLHQDARELTETISLAFMGMAITCARCHNHPMEKWTNDDFYGMVSLVSRVRLKDAGGDGHFVVFSDSAGELVQPVSGRPQPPRPLDGAAIAPEDPRDRREYLAGWLTSPNNPYFTRAIVNRIWANFHGVGLVESVDDLRLTNPASNEKLMEELCAFLVRNRYDARALMRVILQSKTYQRSSIPLPGNVSDERYYSRYYARRLMAEVLLDAVSQVTGVPTDFPGYPRGWRALQLPDSKVASSFLDKFGRNDRAITCECSRSNEPSTVQALHIANGDTVNQKLRTANNQLDLWLAQKHAPEKLVEEIYLSTLTRPPTPTERNELVKLLAGADSSSRRQVLEDVLWAILSTKEFLFNH